MLALFLPLSWRCRLRSYEAYIIIFVLYFLIMGVLYFSGFGFMSYADYKEKKKFRHENLCNSVQHGISELFRCLKKYGFDFSLKSLSNTIFNVLSELFYIKNDCLKKYGFSLLFNKESQDLYLFIVTSSINDMRINKHFSNTLIFYK